MLPKEGYRILNYLLDTDICVYWLRGYSLLKERKELLEEGHHLSVSILTVGELKYGAYRSERTIVNLKAIDQFLTGVQVQPLTLQIMDTYGQIKGELVKQGTPLDEFDLLIACTAIENHVTLVTHNKRHYQRVRSLLIEDWFHSSS